MQKFSFFNWLPLDKPILHVLSPKECTIELAPMAYTLPSPSEGIVGTIRRLGKMCLMPIYKEWTKYALEEDGEELAFVVRNPAESKASPFPSGRPLLPQIGAIVSDADAAKLDMLLDSGDVRARLFNPCTQQVAQSQNVIGMLGEGPPSIVVLAHYDSAFYSPGAVDNASGIQAMFDMIDIFTKESSFPATAFIATGCEEAGLLGAQHCVYHMQEHDLLKHVQYCVNFDMIANGANITLRIGREMETLLDDVIAETKERVTLPVKKVPALAVSDNWPFEAVGIPNMQFVALPYPLYHLDCDTMEQYDDSIVQQVEVMAETLLRTLHNRIRRNAHETD